MFTKKKYERCKYCSIFLTTEQKESNKSLCPDCAKDILSGVRKSFVIRSVLGVICIFLTFWFINHYMLENAVFYDRFVQIPMPIGELTFRPHTFNSLMDLSLLQQILVGIIAFVFPFLRRVRFGFDSFFTFSRQYASNPHMSDHPHMIQGAHRGTEDRLGMLVSELLVSVISGPWFFVRGVMAMQSMRRYINLHG